MSIALDYTRRIDPAALKAAGVSDVCRYLSWMYYWGGVTHNYPNPKIIQAAEFDELVAAGIGVTLNWEYDATDWLGGASAGAAHATEAVNQAKALGYAPGCTIIGSADFNMTRAQWDSAGKAYALAFAATVANGGYRPGVYGPWDVLTWCRDETPISAFWQAGMSTSWSGGRNANPWPGAHLRQRGYLTVGGVQGDRNDILIPGWGQYRGDDMSWSDKLAIPAMPGGPSDPDGMERHTAAEWLTYACRDAALAQAAAASAVTKVDALTDQVKTLAAPTQDQVDAAMLKALSDPSVIAALGAAVASHIHVS